jgi:hypothetical protein
MNIRLILPGAAAFLCAGVLTSAAQISAQGGIQQRPPQPTTQQPRPSASAGPVTTLAGCLYRENAIPGRTPNVAEKAGVLEDYILADAAPAPERNRAGDAPIAEAGQPAGASAGLAAGRMYKVTKLDDERLKVLVGKRVAITGTIKPDSDVRSDEKPTNFENLPNIEGSSIREASGEPCPATPVATPQR